MHCFVPSCSTAIFKSEKSVLALFCFFLVSWFLELSNDIILRCLPLLLSRDIQRQICEKDIAGVFATAMATEIHRLSTHMCRAASCTGCTSPYMYLCRRVSFTVLPLSYFYFADTSCVTASAFGTAKYLPRSYELVVGSGTSIHSMWGNILHACDFMISSNHHYQTP